MDDHAPRTGRDYLLGSADVNARELHARLAAGESAEVLGLRLVPLTIGHVRLMDFLGCSGLRTPDEVALAAIVCSRPQDRVLPFLRSRLLPVRLHVWRAYLGAWDATEAKEKLLAYIKRQTELPLTIIKATPTNCPIPSHQIIRARLLSELGYNPDQIDGTTYLQALWDIRTLDVMEGRVEMMDTTEEEASAAAEAINWESVVKTAEKTLEASQ